MAIEQNNFLDIVWDAMKKKTEAPKSTPKPAEEDRKSPFESIFEKIREAAERQNESASNEEDYGDLGKSRDYDRDDMDDWDEEDDDDREEKEALKRAWKGLKRAHYDEWEALKRRHEDEREALKREHEYERKEVKHRFEGGWNDRKTRRQERRETGRRGGPPPWAGKGKGKDKSKGKGKDKGRGRG